MLDTHGKSAHALAAASTLMVNHLVDLLIAKKVISKEEAFALAEAAANEAQLIQTSTRTEVVAFIGAMAAGWNQRHP